jgi:hypothetical protein
VQIKTIPLIDILSFANVSLNTLENSSYGSLNNGAQQAFSLHILLIGKSFKQYRLQIKRTRKRKLLPENTINSEGYNGKLLMLQLLITTNYI